MPNLERSKESDAALQAGVLRTIPSAFYDVAVSASAGTVDLTDPAGDGSVPSLVGQFIYLQAITENTTVMRGNQPSMAITTGVVVATDSTAFEEFYVAETGDVTLTHIAAGAGTLRIYYDADLTEDITD